MARRRKENATHATATGVLALLVAACGPAAGQPDTAVPEPVPASAETQEPTDAAVPPKGMSPSVDEILAGDVGGRFEKRALSSRSPKLRWNPGDKGFALSCGVHDSIEHIVVDGGEQGLRVVLNAGWANLVAFLDRSEVRTAVTQATSLEQEGVAAPDGVTLKPGAEVTVLEQREGRSKVRVKDACLRIEGWLPDAVIGHQYVPEDMESNLAKTTRQLGPNATITAAGGGVIATAAADCMPAARVQLEGAPKKNGQRIAMQTTRVSIRGSVPVAQLKKVEQTYGMIGLLPNEGDTIEEGTPLYASPDGEQVGIAKTSQRMKRQRSRGGRSEIFVHVHPFCYVPVWVDDAGPKAE